MDNLSKRDIVALIIGAIMMVPLTIWTTVAVIDKFVLVRDPSDPLVKAGSFKPKQMIQVK